jgi:quercetin dioxygenase-like cupin family protein
MKKNHLTLAVMACAVLAGSAGARDPGHGANKAGAVVTGNFSHAIPNIPGKSLIASEVIYPPGVQSRPHHHAHSAFIYAYVVSGSIRSQVDGEPERILTAGQSFFEVPGAHHLVSGNASKTEPAKFLAVFVVDTEDKQLTTPDE